MTQVRGVPAVIFFGRSVRRRASFTSPVFLFQEDVHFWELEGQHRVSHVGADRHDGQVGGRLCHDQPMTMQHFVNV